MPLTNHLLDIAWVIPGVFKGSGGHMTIFRNVAYLSQFGHQNTLYCADDEGRFNSDRELQDFIVANFVDTKARVVRGWNMLSCDIAIATHWSTAYAIQHFPHCSKKFYFVQDFEPYFHPMSIDYLRAENTYRMGFSCITIGRWLTNLIRHRYGADADYFDFAVDSQTNFPRSDCTRNPKVVFCAQPEKPRRCFDLGIRALEIVYHKHPEVEIVLYGSNTSASVPVNFPHKNLGVISPEECAKLYSSAQVGLILSSSNPSLIGFEMMACGCPVVDLDRENNYFDYGPGTVTLAQSTPEAVAEEISRLLEDEDRRKKQTEASLQFIAQRSYEQGALKVEALLLKGWITGRVSSLQDLHLDEFQSLGESEAKLGSGCEQVFYCKADNLCRVDVFMANQAGSEEEDEQVSVTFELLKEEGDQLVHSTKVPISKIENYKWHSFRFPVQSASGGQSYRLRLHSDVPACDWPRLLYTDKPVYPSGKLFFHSRLNSGALKFKTYCGALSPSEGARPSQLPSLVAHDVLTSPTAIEVGGSPDIERGRVGEIETAKSVLGGDRIPQGETLLIKGWVSKSIAESPTDQIQIEIDGTSVGVASVKGEDNRRPFGYGDDAGNQERFAVWSFSVNTEKLALGTHSIEARAYGSICGNRKLAGAKTIEIVSEPTRASLSRIRVLLKTLRENVRHNSQLQTELEQQRHQTEMAEEEQIRLSVAHQQQAQQLQVRVAELTTNRDHLETELEQQRQEIEHLADELEQKGKDLLEELTTSSELRGTLQELTAAANDLVAKIEVIEGSRSWKLVQSYWKWKARWLPENSARLRIYEKLARFVFRSAVVSNATNEAFPQGAAGTVTPSGPSGSVIEQSRMSDITGEATQNNHNGCSEIPISEDDEYQTWLNQNWPRTETLREMRNSTSLLAYRPKISLITPVYNVPPEVLKATLNSIVAQVYDNWELCIVNDGSTLEGVRELLDDYSRHDTRVKVIHSSTNENISAASNRALSIATGEYVAFVDHDDLLAPHALFRVVEALQDKTFDLLYSDEDKLREEGGRLIHFEPLFKPGWSPDTLLSINYIAHLLVIRRKIVEQVGRFRSGFEGSQDHDLALRCLRHLKSVRHIADILYHWRVIPGSTSQSMYEKPNVFRASEQALEQFWYTNYGIDAQVKFDTYSYRIDSREVNDGKVSIIIPFRDKGLHLLRNCVDSILRLTQYPDLEILLIAHQCRKEETLAYLDELSARRQTIRYVRYEEPFNFQKVNNWAASLCKGRYLLFLNNDTEVLEPLWLNDMMVHAMRKDVGAVGPQLLFPDGTIQHAGVILGMTGFSGHVFAGLQSKDCFTSYGSPNWIRNYLAVTAACILIRKDVFEEVGGFDERLVLCGGDVDLCLRIFRTGRRIVYVPTARLLHFESQDRETFIPPGDFLLSWENYKPFLEVGDPYYNPNLSLKHPVPHIRVEEENMFEFAKSIVDKMQEEACKTGN